MFIERPAPEVEKDSSESPAIYQQPADLDKADVAIEAATLRVKVLEGQLALDLAPHDEAIYRGQLRVALQHLESLKLFKSRMER